MLEPPLESLYTLEQVSLLLLLVLIKLDLIRAIHREYFILQSDLLCMHGLYSVFPLKSLVL